MKTSRVIIDGLFGIYVPKIFHDNCDFSQWNLNKADYPDLSSPENEEYWTAWDELLNKATYTDEGGVVWTLEQDQDLFMVTGDEEEQDS